MAYMQTINKLLVLALTPFIISCATGNERSFTQLDSDARPRELPARPQLKNGCLIEAIGAQEALEAKTKLGDNIWSQVLVVTWYNGEKDISHAYTVFNDRNGQIWAYDCFHGSKKIIGDANDPMKVAKQLNILAYKAQYY